MNTAPGHLAEAHPLIPRFAGPTGHLWRVEVQVLGLSLSHIWNGWAADSEEASRRGMAEARQLFRGRALCVRNVLQVGV